MLFLFWSAVLITELRASPEVTRPSHDMDCLGWSLGRAVRAEEGTGQGEMGGAVDLKPESCLSWVSEAALSVSACFGGMRELRIESLRVIQSCQVKVNRHLGAPCIMV